MNWLVIAVIVLIVLATLAGAKRGLVKTVLSFASLFCKLGNHAVCPRACV